MVNHIICRYAPCTILAYHIFRALPSPAPQRRDAAVFSGKRNVSCRSGHFITVFRLWFAQVFLKQTGWWMVGEWSERSTNFHSSFLVKLRYFSPCVPCFPYILVVVCPMFSFGREITHSLFRVHLRDGQKFSHDPHVFLLKPSFCWWNPFEVDTSCDLVIMFSKTSPKFRAHTRTKTRQKTGQKPRPNCLAKNRHPVEFPMAPWCLAEAPKALCCCTPWAPNGGSCATPTAASGASGRDGCWTKMMGYLKVHAWYSLYQQFYEPTVAGSLCRCLYFKCKWG